MEENHNSQPMASVLVVDDYVVTQRVLGTQLRNGGYAVTVAGNAQKALDFLAKQRFDLAIIDVAMPDMDGIALVEKIRGDDRLCGLPIIMLTASVLDEDRLRAKAAGATDFLTKPVSSWELLEVVRRQVPTLVANEAVPV